MWKFNKWLFLSQCSHNWWSDMVLEFRQRFWFSELIVIRISWGQELKAASAAAIAPQDAHKWQHKQNPYEVGMTGENCSLLSLPHLRKETKKRRENESIFAPLHIPQRPFNLTCWVNVYFYITTENSSFPVLAQSIRELWYSKFSHFHFINLFIKKKNAWTPW